MLVAPIIPPGDFGFGSKNEAQYTASGTPSCSVHAMAHVASTNRLPLWVALDGSVVRTDLWHESLLLLIKRNALYLLMAVVWLFRGRAVLRAEVAARIQINPVSLPYNEELLDWLRSERCKGRPIWLCTVANHRLAEAVAAYLGIFDGVIAGGPMLKKHLAAQIPADEFANRSGRVRAALRAFRLHQWAKNVLLFIPLLAAHRANDPAAVWNALLAFISFSLCASSVYLLNDMLDLEADRQHARKSKRPFASGDLPLTAGFVLTPALLLAGALIAAFLPSEFQIVLAFYYLLTLGYSLVFKRIVMIDTTALAMLYTTRVIAGAAANAIQLSFWLLLFCGFFFLSLAFVKRYAELEAVQRRQQLHAAGRGYTVADLPMLEGFGIAAGYMSVLVLAVYVNSPSIAALYRHPHIIWLLCGLMLYWISRIWMKTHRGRMHDDPVIFALRDRVSLGMGLLAAVIVYAAI